MPQVLEAFEKIASTYNKLKKSQEARLVTLQQGPALPAAGRRRSEPAQRGFGGGPLSESRRRPCARHRRRARERAAPPRVAAGVDAGGDGGGVAGQLWRLVRRVAPHAGVERQRAGFVGQRRERGRDRDDDSQPLVINALAARALGFTDPADAVGQTLQLPGWDGKPRPASARPKVDNAHWPEALEPASDVYSGEIYLGPWS